MNIRWGAEIITFFNTEYWGLGKGIPYGEWEDAFRTDPRRYFDAILDGVVDSGSTAIELAPEPGSWQGALVAYGDIDGVRNALESRGLSLASSYTSGGSTLLAALDDPAAARWAREHIAAHAAFVAEMGADLITLGNLPRTTFVTDADTDLPRSALERVADQLNQLGDAARPSGVTLAMHTDAYSVAARRQDLAVLLELTDPATVGVCLDAGHVTLDGQDAVAMLRDHVDRTPIMHWKDCIAPLRESTLKGDVMERHEVMLTYFRILGSGIVDWDEWMQVLKDARWAGWAMNEIDMSPDPVEEIRAGIHYFQEHLTTIYR